MADGVGTLTLHRPDRPNGMINRMPVEASELLAAVAGDTREAFSAFVQKRPARFEGR